MSPRPTTVKLASGREMPLVGFGLWKVPRETCADTVYNAIQAGYRLFDGAYDYENEKEAGEGIQRAIKEGIVKREDLFITTKLWNTYHARDRALEMGRKQNETWGLGYIDLFLIHFPIALKWVDPNVRQFPGWPYQGDIRTENVPLLETWQALETLVDEGVTRSIGVSNFTAQSIYDLQRSARHPISALQIEHHPYLSQPNLISLCKENNIAVTAYSSFGPQSFMELKGASAQLGAQAGMLLEKPEVKEIAARNGVTEAQVLLRWATQRGVAVIPKSNNQGRLAQNLDVLSFDLAEEDMEKVNGLNRGLRFNDPYIYTGHKDMRIFA